MSGTTGAADWNHTSLAVGDLDAASSYYRSAFGYEVVYEPRGITEPSSGCSGRRVYGATSSAGTHPSPAIFSS